MIKDLVYYNDQRLRQRCKSVEKVDDDVRKVVQDLIDSVVYYNGAGLAAPQIGCLIRVFVICVEHTVEADGSSIICPPKVFINPEISNTSEERVVYPEGCLSIPGLVEDVERVKKFTIKALDLNGNSFEESVDLWRARVILHEFDHLEGKLFIDRLDPGVQQRLKEPMNEIDQTFNKKTH
ncbi:peptide deformylase [Candidatus Aerophobetes bacterium]|uniref:Peptide deformylase n=1 Tax=Aerophobetes bacterium TaxID=2030807 RepID=A0A2A4X860_UNCAE|nr:MAG: peptide deformylase [Candidatus Aerophobetes bacterium]